MTHWSITKQTQRLIGDKQYPKSQHTCKLITDHRLARCNVASFPRAAARAEAGIGDLGRAVADLRTSPSANFKLDNIFFKQQDAIRKNR